MGTAGIGNLYAPVSARTADETVAAALAAGFCYFDTAPYYGFGLAERRLGDALAVHDPDRRAIVSTKVGRLLDPAEAPARDRHGFVDGDPFEPRFDYGYDAVLRSHEGSLKRLRRDRVALLLAHDLGALTHGAEASRHMADFLGGGHRALAELRDAGAVDAIGIGVNEVEVAEFLLARVALDVILLAGRYTLLDRSAVPLLDQCAAKAVKVIIGGPYNSGILAAPAAECAEARFDYRPASPAIRARAAALETLCASHGVALPAAALQFPLRHSAVACVIPGLVGADQVRDSVARLADEIPDGLWSALADGAPAPPCGRQGDSGKLLLLHEADNVLVCVSPVAAGEPLSIGGCGLQAREAIPVGHKVARSALAPGSKVIKHGAPIGSITSPVEAGTWVHMHNMKSDYIASHTRTSVAEGQG
jgi:D-threo-aldose 1-dehydrogenase